MLSLFLNKLCHLKRCRNDLSSNPSWYENYKMKQVSCICSNRFEKFLQTQLENSTSSSVRFRPHVEAGLEIAADLEAANRAIEAVCSKKLKLISGQKSESDLKIKKLKDELAEFNAQMKTEIRDLQVGIEAIVSSGIRDEIETIQQTVFDFDDANFVHDDTVIQVYVQQLGRLVEL